MNKLINTNRFPLIDTCIWRKGNCDFNNQTNAGEYASLDTNDKVAAFNIAKRGFENLYKP